MTAAKTILEQNLAAGDLEGVIADLSALARANGHADLTETGTLLSGRYNHLNEQQSEGTISRADYLLERAKISRAALDAIKSIPAHWRDPNLTLASPRSAGQSLLKKWGLPLGVVLGATLAGGIAWKYAFAPAPQPTERQNVSVQRDTAHTVDSTGANPVVTERASQPAATRSAGKPQVEPVSARPKPSPALSSNEKTVQTPPSAPPTNEKTTQTPPSAPEEGGVKTTYASPDGKFHGFNRISEGMERGKIDDKFAFRNLKTRALLCCYDDAKNFKDGKAYVVQKGRSFFIDKNGKEVK